ncbi:MAG: LEA type 2 family protein [Myxococcota bacterium]
MNRLRIGWGLALGVAFLLGGCPSIYAPQVRAENANITGVANGGLQMLVNLTVYNPNEFDVGVDELTAHLILNGEDLGTVRLDQEWTLVAQRDTPMQAQFVVPFTAMPSLVVNAVLGGQVPYTVSGEASVAGYPVTVDYEYQGYVDQAMLINTATQSIGIPFLSPKPEAASD